MGHVQWSTAAVPVHAPSTVWSCMVGCCYANCAFVVSVMNHNYNYIYFRLQSGDSYSYFRPNLVVRKKILLFFSCIVFFEPHLVVVRKIFIKEKIRKFRLNEAWKCSENGVRQRAWFRKFPLRCDDFVISAAWICKVKNFRCTLWKAPAPQSSMRASLILGFADLIANPTSK